MVSLSSLVTVRRVEGPEVIERLDLCPAIGITANPAAGVSISEARILCESLAEELRKELGLQCRLIWVQD
jgi:multidrug efflux pump subunit AcrB